MLFFHFKVQKNLQSTELDSHVEAYISRIRSKQSQIGLVKADILSSTGHHVRSGSLPNFQNPDCPETGRFRSRTRDTLLKIEKKSPKCFFFQMFFQMFFPNVFFFQMFFFSNVFSKFFKVFFKVFFLFIYLV